MNIKWLTPTDRKVPSDKKTVAIIAVGETLIGHYFESEKEALRIMPNIKKWKRETWDSRHIRYHHSSAERFWENKRFNQGFNSTEIRYKEGKKFYKYHKSTLNDK